MGQLEGKKILTCLFGVRQGGFYTRYFRALSAIVNAGADLDYVSTELYPLEVDDLDHVTLHKLSIAHEKGSLRFWISFLLKARRTLRLKSRETMYDAAVVFDSFYAALVHHATSGRIPITVFIRLNPRATGYGRETGIAAYVSRRIRASGVRNADRVVVQSPYIRDVVVDEYGISGDKVVVLDNDIKAIALSDDYDRGSCREGMGIGADDIAVTMTARLARGKRYDVFIDAVHEAHGKDARIHGIIVGDGPEEDALRERVKTHGGESYIHFLGWRDDIDDILAASDVFVLASAFEGVPNALLEAMQHGIPCCGSDIPEISGYLKDCGFCFGNDESGVQSLCDELIRYVNENDHALDIGRACAERASSHRFDWDGRVVEIVSR